MASVVQFLHLSFSVSTYMNVAMFRGWRPRTYGGFFVAIIATAAVSLGVAVPSAHADPHAMFYTVIGQQQLFFNVLAALDQADYVETDLFRDQLLQRRAQAGFRAEQDPIIAQTRTNLSSILTRSVTLEGDDVWSAYLAHQFALEAARRRGLGEVMEVYCERGLGRDGCNDDPFRNPNKWFRDQSRAFVNRPYQRGFIEPIQRGLLAVITPENQQYRQETIARDQDPNRGNNNQRELPVAYDYGIAQMKQNLQGKGELPALYDMQLWRVARALVPASVNPNAYDNISLDGDGNVQLAFAPPGSMANTAYAQSTADAGEYINRYMETLDAVTDVIPSSFSAALAGYDRVDDEINQDLRNPDGTVPDFQLYQVPGINGQVGPIHAQVSSSAAVKQSQAEHLTGALVAGNIDLKYATSDQESTSGSITRTTEGSRGTVQGIQSGSETNTPSATTPLASAVAGIRSDPDFGRKLPDLDPNSELVPFHQEYKEELAGITGITGCSTGYCASFTQSGLQAALTAIGP